MKAVRARTMQRKHSRFLIVTCRTVNGCSGVRVTDDIALRRRLPLKRDGPGSGPVASFLALICVHRLHLWITPALNRTYAQNDPQVAQMNADEEANELAGAGR